MMFSTNSTSKKPFNNTNEFKTKKYFKDNKLSGLYQDFDPYTGKLKEEGRFENGVETGKWKVIDQDGDQIHYSYSQQRVGAICQDGSRSSATGRGACSWHGGVAQWLYDSVKTQIGGTGKYLPIEQRVQDLKKEVRAKFKINKYGLQFQEAVYNILLDLADEKQELLTQISSLDEALEEEKQSKEAIQTQLDSIKSKTKEAKEGKETKQKEAQKVVDNSQKGKKVDLDQSEQEKNQIKTKPKIVEKEKQKEKEKEQKKPVMEPKKQVKGYYYDDDSDQWQSDEDERQRGQKDLIKELFQKMNLK